MNLSDLNNLDLKDIASTTAPVRVLVLIVLFFLIVAGGWYLFWSDAMRSLDAARKEETGLRESYTTKKIQAYHYEAYKARLAEVDRALSFMLRQLPNRAEMDALLTDINQVGVGRGLEFDLFRPGAETKSDFFATLPVAIKVIGNYHDMAGFVSDIAKLPRIVTLHDVSIVNATASANAKEAGLSLEARVQTYRYLDEEEVAQVRQASKKEGKK